MAWSPKLHRGLFARELASEWIDCGGVVGEVVGGIVGGVAIARVVVNAQREEARKVWTQA